MELDETQRFSESIHAAVRALEINTPDTITHDFLAGSPHEPIDCFPVVLVKRNARAAGTEILQTVVNLSTNSKRCRTRGALNDALLFDREDAVRVNVAVQVVFISLDQHILVGVFLQVHRKSNKATAPGAPKQIGQV